jgi:hypothetical protein
MAIKKKFLSSSPEAVDGSKVLFENDQAFRVKNASGVAEEIFKLDGSNVLKMLKLPQFSGDPSAADDLVRKSFVDGQVAAEAAARGTAVTSLQNSISAEVTAREAALAQVVSDYQAADTALEGDIQSEETARIAGDEALDSKIDTEIFDRSAADSLLDGRVTVLETDMGVLKGNSSVVGSVDYKVQQGVAQILGGAVPESLDTLAEIASYIASDETGGAALVGRVGVLEDKVEVLEGGIEVVGSVLYSVEQEKIRAMQAETDLTNLINSESQDLQTQINSLLNDLGLEEAARESGDMALGARLDVIEGSGQGSIVYAVAGEASLREAAVLAEQTARISGDLALEQRLDVVQGIGPNSIFQSLVDAKAYTDQEVAELESAHNTRLLALESDVVKKTYVDEQDAATLLSAQSYTDQEITTLKGGVSESYDTLGKIEAKIGFIMSNVDGAALDSLSEIVAAFQGADSDINTAISDLAATAGTNLAAEQTRAQAAEAALGVRIDGVEADLSAEESARIAGDASTLVDAKAYADAQLDTLVIQQQQYVAKTLVAGDITAQYVDVSGPIQGTPWVMIDGVMGRPGVDFTHSGSRITFAGEWATGGASALAASDTLHIFFMKNYSPFV